MLLTVMAIFSATGASAQLPGAVPSVETAVNIDLQLNFQKAIPQGCGEYGFGPKFSYRVYVNGERAHESAVEEPVGGAVWFNDLLILPVSTPATLVGVEVWDHYFTFFGHGSSACNVTSTDSTRYNFSYKKGEPQFVRTGGVHQAAGLELYISDSSVSRVRAPGLDVSGAPEPTRANVTWPAIEVPGFTEAELVHNANRTRIMVTTSVSESLQVLLGLRENTRYNVGLLAKGGNWRIEADRSLLTANLPPPAPMLNLRQTTNQSASVGWTDRPHDLAQMDFYLAAGTNLPPSNETHVATQVPDSFWRTWPETIELTNLSESQTYYLIARATDSLGAPTDSIALRFAAVSPAPPQTPTPATPSGASPPTATPAPPAVHQTAPEESTSIPPSTPTPTPTPTATPTPTPTTTPTPASDSGVEASGEDSPPPERAAGPFVASVRIVGLHAASVTWRVSEGTTIGHFIVRLLDENGTEHATRVLGPNDREATFDNLEPAYHYQAVVTAVSEDGRRLESTFAFQTESPAPPTAPTKPPVPPPASAPAESGGLVEPPTPTPGAAGAWLLAVVAIAALLRRRAQ